MASSPRTLILSCMKNEGPFILEWVAHALAIGVNDFLIYTNDCDDGTDAIWQRLEAMGIGQHRENEVLKRGVQKSALFHASKEPKLAEADWLMVLDVDEFINIHVGGGTLDDLRAACPQANVFSMTWRLFGDGGRIGFRDAFITEQFQCAAPHFINAPAQAWGIKTLFKNDGLFGRLGIHTPLDPIEARADEIVTVNGSGTVVPAPEIGQSRPWRSDKSTYGYDLVQLNHYAVRSVESFLVKSDRGRVNHMDHEQGFEYWAMMSQNRCLDVSLSTKLAATRAKFDELMADETLRSLHETAVAWHQTRIRTLKQQNSYARLFDNIVAQIALRQPPRIAA